VTLAEDFIKPRELPADLHLPPGPKSPAAVQTLLFMMQRTWIGPRWHRKYGDVFSVNLAPAGQAVILAKPEHIREVFAGPPHIFHAGEGNAILGPVMGEHSVLLLDEEEHLAARKRVMAAFHGESMRSYGTVIEDLTARRVATWPDGGVVALHNEMNEISLEVIMRIVFGVTDEQRLEQMRPLLRKLVQIGPTVFLGWLYPRLESVGPWRRYKLLKERTDQIMYAEIAHRRTVADLDGRTDVLWKTRPLWSPQ